MLTAILTQWGSSLGIRIPSAIINEANLVLGVEFEIRAEEGGIRLIPIKSQQEGWREQFDAIADSGFDEST